jgi:hypothetical protein
MADSNPPRSTVAIRTDACLASLRHSMAGFS